MRQLLLGLCILISPLVYSQSLLDKEVSIKFQKVTLEKCVNQLEKTSGISFSYNSRQIHAVDKKINLSFENKSLSLILDKLLAGTKLQYKEIGNQITVYALTNTKDVAIISGHIQDKNSGEELIGARIVFPKHRIGTISNSYGYYAIEIPKGNTTMKVSSVGMLTQLDEIDIQNEIIFNVGLSVDTLMLNVIEVVSSKVDGTSELVDLPNLSHTIITPLAISKVPAASGECDLLRHLQQLPGVQPSNDGGANFIVRGSGTGGNLILMDEIPIYHPTHLLGIYSIINTDALKSATLYKDFIPLRYGDRSASVLQIHNKEGNLNKHHIAGGISGFMARLNVEGPIVKKKASFYTSGRFSTFPGALLSILGNRSLGNPTFYDLNGKVNVKLNSNNRIYLTGYFGRDGLTDTNSFYQWGNVAGAFRWNHVINTKTFSNLSITHSEFSYGFSRFDVLNSLSFGQKVVTDKVNYDFTYYLNNTTKINYGMSTAFLRTRQGNFSEEEANLFLQRQSLENGVYASIEKKFSPSFNIKAGIRLPYSFHIGAGDTTSYLNSDLSKTQVIYQKNKFYDFTFFADPRIVGTYNLTENNEFQFAAMVTSQNTHIINYINNFLPIEIWTPSTDYLKPERNYQASIGWTNHWKDMHTSVIAYHKYVVNVLDYASPVFTASTDIESNLLAGSLRVSGLEMMINYKFTTWYSASVSYAYTKTRQKIDGINNNLAYVAPSDRPHYFSFSQYFNLSKKWVITTNFTAHTGTAITLPNGQFVVDGTAFPLYSSNRNTERLPTFRRVDMAFKRNLGVKKKKNHWDLTFTITNFFNRYNPSVAFVQQVQNTPGQLKITTVDYSPTMVSLNLNFRY